MIFCRLHLRELCYNSTPKGKILEYPQPYINIGVLTRSNKGAFSDCYNLETVYFKGTAASFNSITIDTGNENLTDVLYYYSETEPTSDGYYWHYDLDGTTPIVWVKEN